MLNVQDQCMSLQKLIPSAKCETGFLSKAYISKTGKIPNTTNKMIPGNKKSLNGDLFKMDSGKPPNNLPEGEMIKAPPPPIAFTPRKANKIKRIFRAIVIYLFANL